MFSAFIDKLAIELDRQLPGNQAQYEMAPPQRREMLNQLSSGNNPRKSSVLVLLFPDQENSSRITLIKRADYDGYHSGQIAFPGGKYEETDPTLYQTALRETEEEIGLSPHNIVYLGKLTELLIPVSNFMVYPFVAYTTIQPRFKIDEKEVQNVITPRLDAFFAEGVIKSKRIEFSNGKHIETPFYEIDGRTIWGATAMILSELRAIIKKVPPFSAF